MPALLVLVAVAWWYFGDLSNRAANWFYENDAAPWETVDAFYYPSRHDLTKHESVAGLSNVLECRRAVYDMAVRYNDQSIRRGDYECAVGRTGKSFGGIPVYRLTVQ